MNQMNVGGVNPGQGAPAGGMPMMNSGSNAPRGDANANIQEIMVVKLNTYIYDYFIKRGYHDCARALVQDESVPVKTSPRPKQSPGSRRDGVNGVDGDAMVTDSKEDQKSRIPDDLPRPDVAESQQQNSFLFDWFNLFWDMFSAQRNRDKISDATRYLQHTQNVLRMQNQQLLRQPQMMPATQFNQYNAMRNARNGMMPNNLPKSVLQNKNMSPQQIAQLQHKNQQAQMLQHQVQREHSEMDMNGHRPQSPASTENAPSPSKRPRLEGSQVNGQQMAPNGRGQGQAMPGQPNQQANVLLMQHGINPKNLTQAQYNSFQAQNPAVQAKSIQVYAQNLALHHSRSAMNNQGMPNGMMNTGVMPNQGDMIPPMPEGQGLLHLGEYYNSNGQMGPVRPGMQTPAGQNGNHALQDYQMQLMMLEQQNKRRLIMARQEQDTMARADGQPGIPGQPGLPPGTSPQDSRSGASPNPGEQMKRGTPKMPQTGLPGSPSAAEGMAGRGSPASMGFNGGQMPPDMANAQYFHMKNMSENMVAPNGMRPPSSNPAFSGPQGAQSMDAMARQQQPPGAGNRMPSGNWQPGPQGQPMPQQQQQQQQQSQQQQQQPQQQQPQQQQQQPSGAQPQSVGTPQERNTMPPPQAPAGGANAGRTQPSSPQTAPAPPTPQQSNKPAPKGKKDTKDNNRKRLPKKGANAATNTTAAPSSEPEQPTTTTPSTPITAVHQNTFNNKGAANATSNPPQQASAPAAQPPIGQQPQDPNPQSFDNIMGDAPGLNVDFAALDSNEMGLDTFDFDNFLNADGTNDFVFDSSSLGFATDSLEAGATDPM